jgi:hypothetical protein
MRYSLKEREFIGTYTGNTLGGKKRTIPVKCYKPTSVLYVEKNMKLLAKISGLIDDVMSVILTKLIEVENNMDKDWIITSYKAKYELMELDRPYMTDDFIMLSRPSCLDKYHYPKDKDITLMQLCEDYNFCRYKTDKLRCSLNLLRGTHILDEFLRGLCCYIHIFEKNSC